MSFAFGRVSGVTLIGALLATTLPSAAAVVRFDATGVAGISGYVEFDDSSFNGSNFQFLSNSAIVGLALDVFGSLFSLADVTTTASTIIDSSGLAARIVNGAGELANNGTSSISFFPDGFGGTPSDGDASLNFADTFNAGGANGEFFAVKWTINGGPTPVPVPASFPLLALGLGAVAALSRRKTS